MGLLTDWLTRSPAMLAIRNADRNHEPTPAMPPPASSIPDDTISWNTTSLDWTADAYGAYCREYAVRIVIDFITRNIASLPFKVYEKDPNGDPREVHDGALADLMRRPSRVAGMSRYRFIANLLRDMLIDDRWLCRLTIVDGRFELRRIPPDRWGMTVNGLGEPVSVRIGDAAGMRATVRLPDPSVVMDVGYLDGLGQCSPVVDVLRPLLAEARAMEDYRKKLASNGAQVPAYVYRPKEMPWETQEDYDAFTQSLRAYSKGGGSEGMWPTLKDGMEIRTLDNLFKPVDMNDLEARDRISIAVANAFQISPENLGLRKGTNSNIAAYKEKLWNVELMPYLVALEEALNLTLPDAVGEPDRYIKANIDAKLRGTMIEQYQALSTATGRPFMTTNQARRILDMPAIDGGDELITPLNVIAGGQPSPQDGGRTQNAQQGT